MVIMEGFQILVCELHVSGLQELNFEVWRLGYKEACQEGQQAVRRPVRKVARLSEGLSEGLL